ncbi:MAG TPA: HAD family hydrolase [Candidatus Elarobacter sp.]
MSEIALGFDFDHTLGLDNGLERTALYRYAEELGVALDPNDADRRAYVDALLAVFRAGEISLEEMVRRFGAWLGVAADPDRWRAICYALVDELVVPVEGARETIAALRARGVSLAVLTNGWTPLQQKKIARALGPGAFETILVSDAIGAYKPDPKAFELLVAALGVPRERCWYVGDNPLGDVAGALAAGLRAVWFDWEGVTYPSELPPPTLKIHALRELETLVENAVAP